jgi:hypothetical protein
MNLSIKTFEETGLYLIERFKALDFSEASDHWTIKFNEADNEWYVRWSNGLMDSRHREIRAFVWRGKFYYI